MGQEFLPAAADLGASRRHGEWGERTRTEQERSIVRNLRSIYRTIQSYSKWVEKQCGVSSTMLWVLWELLAAGEMKISQVAGALSIHQSTASNLLDKLERRGLVARKRGTQARDQRVVLVYLTDEGQKVLADAPGPAQGPLTEALARLDNETLRQLSDGLDNLVGILGIKDPEAALKPLSDDF
jgi:DNA-binding MarR family transcriptional regulator